MSKLSIIFLFLIPLLVSAQHPPDTLWTKLYVDGYQAGGSSVQQTMDGGFIVTGSTTQYGSFNADLYLVKTDVHGDTIWTRTFGGYQVDIGWEVQQTDDGGYIVVGVTIPLGEVMYDVYLIKTDENGNAIWTRNYGSDDSDFGHSVVQTLDGGYIVSGNTNPNDSTCYIFLMKTDAYGDTVWTRTFTDEIMLGQGYSVIRIADGNYMVTGIVWPYWDYGDVFLMKFNENGDTLWMQTYGGDWHDAGESVKQTQDSGFVIGGSTRSYGSGWYDFYLIKTDSEGDTFWTRTYGGYDEDLGYCVDQTFDGGYIITGMTESFSTAIPSDLYLIRTDSIGDTLWTCTYGDSGDGDIDYGYSVQQTADGGFIVAGKTNSYDPDTYTRMWLLRFRWDGVLVEDWNNHEPTDFQLYPAYPNPFNAQTAIPFTLDRAGRITLNIYNINGQTVGAKSLSPALYPAGIHEFVWNAEGMASGVYLVRLDVVSTAESAIGTLSTPPSVQKVVFIK